MNYIDVLFASRLPIPVWAVVAAWPPLFVANHVVVRMLRAANARQTCITLENSAALRRGSQPLWIFAQVLYAVVVFMISVYAGGALFVLLGGGLDVSMICVLGLNLQALWAAHAMERAGTAEGAVKLSNAYAFRQLVSRLAGAAVATALLGLLLAQLALLGGAALLGAAAFGYLRRANAAQRASSISA